MSAEHVIHLEVRAVASNGAVTAYDEQVTGPAAVLPRLRCACDSMLADLREQGLL